jgi:hypothetical protein
VPEFLSAEWIAALDDAARDARGLAVSDGDPPFVVEHRVRDAGGDRATHHIVFTGGGARVAPGAGTEPDVVMTIDLATARSLALGTTNAQRALAVGHLRVDGDMDALAAHADLLLAVDDVFAAVRSATTFSGESGR